MSKKEKRFILIVIIVFVILLIVGSYIQLNNKNVIDSPKINLSIDDSKLNIFCFYVGQADCTLIINEGETLLLDVGNKTDGQLIVNCLKQFGIEKIDYLIGTHSDNDHIGGMMDIVNNFEIQNLYMPQKEENDQSYIEIKKKINIQKIEINDIIKIGEATAIVKWIDNEEKYSDNNSSIVLQLNYKDKKYLFTGDIETKVENELIKQNALEEIDVLKVAHHGSNSSTSEKFLNIIKPEFAIISSGSTYNKFPNVECLKRILKFVNKENIFITERDGTIWITSDGITAENIQKLNEINLDGSNSQINQNELNTEYLESIQISMVTG
ncbi:MAG: MBL fold metallo-hydrolase [Clostridia bacterium]|nr:MBL fold metallo-hydrolase [Clostridia bacterium]